MKSIINMSHWQLQSKTKEHKTLHVRFTHYTVCARGILVFLPFYHCSSSFSLHFLSLTSLMNQSLISKHPHMHHHQVCSFRATNFRQLSNSEIPNRNYAKEKNIYCTDWNQFQFSLICDPIFGKRKRVVVLLLLLFKILILLVLWIFDFSLRF